MSAHSLAPVLRGEGWGEGRATLHVNEPIDLSDVAARESHDFRLHADLTLSPPSPRRTGARESRQLFTLTAFPTRLALHSWSRSPATASGRCSSARSCSPPSRSGSGIAWWPLALIVVPVLVWLFAFFRDPEREIPAEQHVMVSPADGTVSDITEIEHDELLGGPRRARSASSCRSSTSTSTAARATARCVKVDLQEGQVHQRDEPRQGVATRTRSTRSSSPSRRASRPIAVVKQIVGLIARRIIFTAKEGDVAAARRAHRHDQVRQPHGAVRSRSGSSRR